MKNLKKIFAAVLCLVLVFGLASCGSKEEDHLARIKKAGKLVIATEGNWSPWTFHDEKDQLTGMDIELGKALAKALGVEAEFQETDWDSILAGVKAGRFDMACNGVGYTEERAQTYSFSTPYVYTHKVLVVGKDNEDIKTLEDLAGKTTANSPSSTYAAIAEQYGATVTSVSTLTETMMLLEQGRVDATVNAQVSVEDYLKQHPDAPIKVVQVLDGDPVAIPMPQGDDSASLVEAVNKALDDMRKSGELSDLSIKYFGLDMTENN